MTRLLLALGLMVAPSAPGTTDRVWDDVVARYAAVRDYTCVYVKEERAIDHGERQTIRLSFRKPLDIRMEWLDDRGDVDQIAVYRQGMNDGKLIARRRGVLGSVVGTLHLDPRDRRVLQDSKHPITEVGFGPIVEGIARALRSGAARITGAVDVAGGRRVEMDVAEGTTLLDVTGVRRITIVIGAGVGLPTTVEIFDAAGGLLERHRFSDIRVNVGLGDGVFTL